MLIKSNCRAEHSQKQYPIVQIGSSWKFNGAFAGRVKKQYTKYLKNYGKKHIGLIAFWQNDKQYRAWNILKRFNRAITWIHRPSSPDVDLVYEGVRLVYDITPARTAHPEGCYTTARVHVGYDAFRSVTT